MTAAPPSNAASDGSTNIVSSRSTGLWSDLPRRLGTICIGFPLVWTMLKTPSLAYLFFMGAHALSAWEFTLLEPRAAVATKATQSTAATPSQRQHQSSLPPPPSASAAASTAAPRTPARVLFCVISLLLASVPGIPSSSSSSSSLFLLALGLAAGAFAMMQKRHWMVGLLLVTVPFRAWMAQCHDFAGTISVLLVVWNADTGALLGGRLASLLSPSPLRRRWPVPAWVRAASPSKSMEGFVGGVLCGTWTAVSWIPPLLSWAAVDTSPAYARLWLLDGRRRYWLGLSLSLLAIAGDLVESTVKRQSQSKDSGSALPGHGGILDRFDSSLLAVLLYQVLIEWADAGPDPSVT